MASLRQKTNKELLRKFLTGYLPFIPLGIIVFAFVYYGHQGETPGLEEWDLYLLVIFLTILTRAVIFRLERLLNRQLPWWKYMGWRLLAGWIAYSLVFMLIATVAALVVMSIQDQFNGSLSGYIRNHQEDFVKLLVLGSSFMLIYSIIYFSYYSYNEYSKGEIEQLALKRKQLELQLDLLKSQLSPHYLFNSLNTISSLIYKDAQLAEEFIRRLAGTYNYIISTNDKLSVSLQEEVEFIKSYHYLLKVRFENNINLRIDLDEEILGTLIPPLTLQLLVENAVKHNEISRTNPLNITIAMLPNGRLRVWNNRSGQNTRKKGFHIGLENIRKRYKYLTPSKIEINESENFEVTLPLIPGP